MATTQLTVGLLASSAMVGAGTGSAQQVPMIELPQPSKKGSVSVEAALTARRSGREYGRAPLSAAELGQLLWAAQGCNRPDGTRTAPSAGALYPLELYVAVGSVRDVPVGVYRYVPRKHALVRVADEDARAQVAALAAGQRWIERAAALLVFAGVYERTTQKYGDRGVRYVHMEVGHAAQNVYLQAAALGLATVVIGAFDDRAVQRIMQLEHDERPLAVMPIGQAR